MDFEITLNDVIESLRTTDNNELRKIIEHEIDWAKKEIVKWLEDVREVWKKNPNKKCNDANFPRLLAESFNITEMTAKYWLEKTRFPNNDNLSKIFELGIRQTPDARKPQKIAISEKIRNGRQERDGFRGLLFEIKYGLISIRINKTKIGVMLTFSDITLSRLLNKEANRPLINIQKLNPEP